MTNNENPSDERRSETLRTGNGTTTPEPAKLHALAEQFELNRPRLRAVAFRALGSTAEADDAVQEAWLRLSRTDADGVDNLAGWLTTVVGRVALDMLRARRSRREAPLPEGWPETARDGDPRTTARMPGSDRGGDPEGEAVLADSVGLAMLVVLETLDPAERLAFVLHDMFAVPYDDIGAIVGRSPVAARQLASRARRRVQGASGDCSEAGPGHSLSVPGSDADRVRKRAIVAAFLAAARDGDFDALVGLLDPAVVLRADDTVAQTGADKQVLGASAVAATFSGRARAARLALVDGAAGLVWSQGGRPRVVFEFTIVAGGIVAIDMLGDADHLAELDLDIL